MLDGTIGTDHQRALIQEMIKDSDNGIRSARIVRTKKKVQASRDDTGENDIDVSEDVTKTVLLDHEGTEEGAKQTSPTSLSEPCRYSP